MYSSGKKISCLLEMNFKKINDILILVRPDSTIDVELS